MIDVYEPNLKDSRVVKSIIRALEFCYPRSHKVGSFSIHNSKRTEIFGNSTRPITKWLEANLIQHQHAGYIVGSRSQLYKINSKGCDKITKLLIDHNIIDHSFKHQLVISRYADELSGAVPFDYYDKSYRLWHPLQFHRREDKANIMSGWTEVDISSAMPSMFVSQQVIFTNKRGFTNPSVIDSLSSLPSMKYYKQNKQEIREQLALDLSLTILQIKKIINSLFLGARLVPYHKCSIFKDLDYDEERFNRLKNNAFIVNLREDIKKFWRTTYIWFNQERSRNGLPPIKKNLLYFYFERQVLDVVDEYISKNLSGPFLHEHDGFRILNNNVNKEQLGLFVNNKLNIELDWD